MYIIQEQTNIMKSAQFITNHIHNFLLSMGVGESYINFVNFLILLVAATVIVFILQGVVRNLLFFLFKRLEKITGMSFFGYVCKNKLPHYLALVVPYTFIINSIPLIFADYPVFITPLIKLSEIYLVFMVIWTMMSIITSLADLIQYRPGFEGKPLKSYLQIIQILLYLFGIVVVYCILTGSSPTAFFAAMGAASAILMLMFKDTIMGFVGSIQISTNSMVKLGDWITVSKYGADGTVEEINLTTVKVRNFDNTITTIPTYSLISDSFQNWRGMQESGARRIKRALIIKQSDIRPLFDKELEAYMGIDEMASFITKKKAEYEVLNTKLKISGNSVLDGFKITNCDLFIRYATLYLQNNPNIRHDIQLMVRELSPTINGLPIEVYAFTKATAGGEYERVISEIFNHLIYRVKDFGLTIFETSSSSDSLTVNLQKTDKQD